MPHVGVFLSKKVAKEMSPRSKNALKFMLSVSVAKHLSCEEENGDLTAQNVRVITHVEGPYDLVHRGVGITVVATHLNSRVAKKESAKKQIYEDVVGSGCLPVGEKPGIWINFPVSAFYIGTE